MTDPQEPTTAQKLIGDFAPKLVSLTDDVLFGDGWARPELSPRDRSLITVAALITGGDTEQLRGHLDRARQNGLTETELKESIIHLAAYAGWPKAMSPSPWPSGCSATDGWDTTMTTWTTDELSRIGGAEELQIASLRPDGTLRPYVTIWVVRARDDLYVRSAYGTDNPWFRRARASGAGRIRAGGLERDVTFAEPAPEVHADIDKAYHAKYDRYGPSIVGTVVGGQAAPTTIRLARRTA
jgi:alkylhydroperoxidase/carboxymuconolactone decarboxylase family protein YurZ